MTESLEAKVTAALSRIQNPRLENDVLSAGMIRDLAVAADGRVAFTFLLGREDPATLVRETRAAIRGIEGVGEVKITVVDPSGPVRATHGPPTGAVPAAGVQPGSTPGGPSGNAPGSHIEAPDQPNLGKVLAVSSGKGGVGKSTVTANLAVALAQAGHRVAIMDADVYGPNIPRMFGVFDRPAVINNRIQPLEAYGVKLMSLGFLVERDAPAIWRGPIIMKIVQQFLRDVDWGQLDYFLVDLPPGTGDAQLSLAQSTQVAAALIVTTPQEMAVGDALRGARMFEKVGVPVLGIVENMAGFTDPETGRRWELFGNGGGERLAREIGSPLIGSVPLQPNLAQAADEGRPVLIAEPESPAAQALRAIAERVAEQLGKRTVALPILNN